MQIPGKLPQDANSREPSEFGNVVTALQVGAQALATPTSLQPDPPLQVGRLRVSGKA